MTTLSAYLSVAGALSKWQAIASKSPAVSTATAYYKAHIGEAKSAAALVRNPRLFNYAMKAFGLGDRTDAKALMTRAMNEGALSSSALAVKLHDPNILAFVKAFDFKDNGATAASTSAAVQKVVDLYAENALETDQGKQNPGVELALYFQRKAPSIKDAYSVLADKKLLKVVQTALNISPMTGLEPIDQQAKLMSGKIKFADFQDPKKLQAFLSRFSAMYDYGGGSSSGGSNPTNAILFDSSAAATDTGFGPGFLQSLQGYRAV